jgi:hypothetical protein
MPAGRPRTCSSSGSRVQVLSDAFRSLGIEPAAASSVLAVGWATVELDRAARELGSAFGLDFVDAVGSIHLGCACRRSVAMVEGVHVVLLEPTTEGRLAVTLARHGEGLAAAWFRAPWEPMAQRRSSAARPGPVGAERRVLGGPVSGPHHLLVVGATIRMP